ncbi:MAG: hypothetical protein FJ170_05375 [Gammaproteobacteria bacterium]|nr:hypothetical protein [Gammaproteobacteria bacterium]
MSYLDCAVLAVIAAVLAWRMLTINMAEYFAREPGSEAAALKWAPHHPQALFAQGVASAARDAERAADELAAALRANPTNGPAYAALARLHEAAGDVPAAARAMETAAAMAPRRIDVQTEAAAFWMRRGDIARALLHWDVVLTFGTDLRARLFPDLLRLVEQPATLAAFAPLLQKEVAWWPDFFAYAANNAAQVDTVQALFNLQAKGPNATSAPALRTFLGRLQREGLWTEAYFIWLNSLSKEQINNVGNLFNGGFEYPISSVGFDWIIDPLPQVLVETAATHGSTGSRALHVVFRGSKTAYRHLRQHLLLPPGSYSLRGRVRPESLETAQGLQWAVWCAGGKAPLATSERFLGSDQWRHFSLQFAVPKADCPVQMVRLELAGRTVLDFEARGGIWFDDISVERQRLD